MKVLAIYYANKDRRGYKKHVVLIGYFNGKESRKKRLNYIQRERNSMFTIGTGNLII